MKRQIIRRLIILCLLACLFDCNVYPQCDLTYRFEDSGGKIWTERTGYFFMYNDCESLMKSYDGKKYVGYSINEIVEIEYNEQRKIFDKKTSKLINESEDYLSFDYMELLFLLFNSNIELFYEVVDDCINGDCLPINRLKIAEMLKFDEGDIPNIYLNKLKNDTCNLVKLEVAMSLSYLGDQQNALEIIRHLLKTDSANIHYNRFSKTNKILRNINNKESTQILLSLTQSSNDYCAIDAIACLYQMDELKDAYKSSLRIIKNSSNSMIFISILLINYYYNNFKFLEFIEELNKNYKGKKDFINCYTNKLSSQ